MSTMMQWILVHPYTIWKKCVFNLEINISTVLAIWMFSGKSFHVLTVAMLNARSPYAGLYQWNIPIFFLWPYSKPQMKSHVSTMGKSMVDIIEAWPYPQILWKIHGIDHGKSRVFPRIFMVLDTDHGFSMGHWTMHHKFIVADAQLNKTSSTLLSE